MKKNEANEIVGQFSKMDIMLVDGSELLDSAWEIGSALKAPALYDCFYVALAQLLGAPLWTADKKLYDIASRQFRLLRLL